MMGSVNIRYSSQDLRLETVQVLLSWSPSITRNRVGISIGKSYVYWKRKGTLTLGYYTTFFILVKYIRDNAVLNLPNKIIGNSFIFLIDWCIYFESSYGTDIISNKSWVFYTQIIFVLDTKNFLCNRKLMNAFSAQFVKNKETKH